MNPEALLSRLTKRQRQMAALAVLLLAILLVWSLVAAPVLGWFADHHGALTQTRRQAETAQRTASHGPELSRKLETLKAGGVLKASLFAPAAEPNPAAKLQAEARRLLGASGAQIANSQILPETSGNGLRRLALRVTLRGSLEKLQKAVHGLEALKAPVFIQGLSLRSPHAAPRPGTAPPPAADLTMVLELHAFMEAAP